jgi:signal transduction histidine kinase
MEAIGQLTGGVAHDFNNLLNVVVANLERVQRQLPTDSPLLKPVRNAMTGAERAASTTHKLLAFARKQPLSPSRCDVSLILTELGELLRSATDGRARIEMVLAPNPPLLELDRNQFENAILNLAVNARDAMLEGGVLTIVARPAEPSDGGQITQGVIVEVQDTGAGMTPEVIARASEPFFTTKPLGQGTGLGLSQVVGFVQQSGGSLEIISAPHQGTTIRLIFPVATAAPSSVADQLSLADPGAALA